MNQRKRCYFVRHLPISDQRRKKGHVAQVQLVDKYGQAVSFGYIGDASQETILNLDGENVPVEVIAAALRQPPGTSNFVDQSGEVIAPKDLLDN